MGVEQPPVSQVTAPPVSPEAARLQEELLREQLKDAKRKNRRTRPLAWVGFILLLALIVPAFFKGYFQGGATGNSTNVGGGGVPFIAPKPTIPIAVTFRTALLRNSGVAVLKNDAGHL